ncbi:MAG: hypothetical protein ABFC94_01620 [Syntrophomonas sp.]
MNYGVISIKPIYINKILTGDKKFEFRKKAPSLLPVAFLLYSTSPVKMIVGVAYISSVIKDNPKKLWERCSDHSGVDEDDFKRYFKDYETGYALFIDSVESFIKPLEPGALIKNFIPPQSFYYLEEGFCLPN